MSVFSYPRSPEGATDESATAIARALRQVCGVVNRILSGKLNNIGEMTLTTNSASTTLLDPRLTVGSFIDFDPLTAHAATELYGATMYVTTANRGNGSFVITHANNAQNDRTFKYTIIG